MKRLNLSPTKGEVLTFWEDPSPKNLGSFLEEEHKINNFYEDLEIMNLDESSDELSTSTGLKKYANVIRLKDFPKALKQLEDMAENPNLAITSQEVKESDCYNLIVNSQALDASNIKKPKIILLVAKIAAISSSLKKIDISDNLLAEHSLAIAEILNNSTSLNTLYMNDNILNTPECQNIKNTFGKHYFQIPKVLIAIHSFCENGDITKDVAELILGNIHNHIDFSI